MMKMTNARLRLSVFSPALFISIVACAPAQFQDAPPSVRPVRPASDAFLANDEVDYQGAVRAINDRDYGRALDYLQAAQGMQANDVRVLNAFGVIYDKLGRFDLSARYYAEALAADPRSAIVLKNVAYSRVLQGMADGHETPPVMAAALPAPADQIAAKDLTQDHNTVMAPTALPLGSQMLPNRAPVMVLATQPTPTIPTAASIPLPNLAPIMDLVELVPEPQMLPPRDPMMVEAAVPSPLSPASLPTPDLAPAEMPQEPKILPRRAPVNVAAALPAPASFTPAILPTPDLGPAVAPAPFTPSLPIPDLGPVVAPAELALAPPILPRKAPLVVEATPSPLATPASISDLPPVLAPPRRSAPAKETLGVRIALTLPTARHAVLSQPSFDVGVDVAQLKRSAEVAVQESRSNTRSPRVPSKPGRHLIVIDATGQSGVSEPVRQHLSHLGWTAPLWAEREAAHQSFTTIRYMQSDSFTAHALARTLPFPVHLTMCADRCNGLELIVGSNYLGWKPKHRRAQRWANNTDFLTSGLQRSENDLQ